MNKRSTWLMVALLVTGASHAARAQGPVLKDPNTKLIVYPDITCRPALYFGGEFGYAWDGNPDPKANAEAFSKIVNLPTMLKGARYVTPGQTITLTKDDAIGESNTNGKEYAFNLGYYLFFKRPNGSPPLTAFAIRVKIGSKVIAQMNYAPPLGKETLAVHTQPYLPVGENLVTLSIDDDNQIQESNEKNNLYTFRVIVNP